MDRDEAEHAEAMNPATPAPRLARLMEQHLEAVLDNPALKLVLLERPDFWRLLSRQAEAQLARSPRCPVEFAAWVIQHPDHFKALSLVSRNKALPVAIRRAALFRDQPRMWSPGEYEPRPFHLDLFDDAELALLERAQRPDFTEAEFERLLAFGALGGRLAAEHPACPPGLRERLLARGERSVVLVAAPDAHPDADATGNPRHLAKLRHIAETAPRRPWLGWVLAWVRQLASIFGRPSR